MKKILILFVVISTIALYVNSAPVEIDNVPLEISKCLKDFQGRYQIDYRMNPFYLRADFDKDGSPDYAVLITETATKKQGFAVCFGDEKKKTVILGAGVTVKLEGGFRFDDLDTFDVWDIDINCDTDENECLYLGRTEAGSGRFIWNGKSFVWEQGGI